MNLSLAFEFDDNADWMEIAGAIRRVADEAASQLEQGIIQGLNVDDSVYIEINNPPLQEASLFRVS